MSFATPMDIVRTMFLASCMLWHAGGATDQGSRKNDMRAVQQRKVLEGVRASALCKAHGCARVDKASKDVVYDVEAIFSLCPAASLLFCSRSSAYSGAKEVLLQVQRNTIMFER